MKIPWMQAAAKIVIAAALAAFAAGGPVTAAQNRAAPRPAAKAKPAPPAPASGLALETTAKHALIIEADTGAVLYDKHGEERMAPASMSKMMTAYVVFGMLKEGRAQLTDELPVSEKAWRLGGSKMFVGIGGRIPIDDLLKGVLIQSGNDACVVLAEGLAGSEAAFVDLMNKKAQEIGLKDSHFDNVTGLPDPNHWMTAHDLAALAIRTIRDFPEYYHYYSEKEFRFNNIEQGNRNPLLYKNIGADGLKTGHTEEAGYSLTASVVRGDRRVILVVGGLSSMKERGSESERLIEWAFREFNNYKLFSAGDKVDEAEVWLGAVPKVGLVVDRDLVITMPRRSRRDMKVTLAYDRPVPAPIKKGVRLGKIVVTAPDIAAVERPVYADADVVPIGTAGRMATVAAHLIWGNRH